jgi:hypothetical protein
MLAAPLALAAASASGQLAATVEAIQMPAWVERDARRTPLVPGMELKTGDVVHTGDEARLMMKLAEGSLLKLGQNGSLRFANLVAVEEPPKADKADKTPPKLESLRAAVEVLEGAFRFTTERSSPGLKRQLSVRLAQVAVAIRGTDLWGRSEFGRETVCLIEGRIEVAAEGESPVVLVQPRQLYQREYGFTLPLAAAEPDQVADWVREVEIAPGRGAARRGGRWNAVLAADANQAAALAVYDELRGAGYPAEILPTPEGGRLVYVVLIRRMPSRAEAIALGELLRGRYGIITNPRASQ